MLCISPRATCSSELLSPARKSVWVSLPAEPTQGSGKSWARAVGSAGQPPHCFGLRGNGEVGT